MNDEQTGIYAEAETTVMDYAIPQTAVQVPVLQVYDVPVEINGSSTSINQHHDNDDGVISLINNNVDMMHTKQNEKQNQQHTNETKKKIVKETKKKEKKTKEKKSIQNNTNKSKEKKVAVTKTKVKDTTIKKKVKEKKIATPISTAKNISRKAKLEREKIEAQEIFENPTCVTTAFLIRKALKHSYGFGTSTSTSKTSTKTTSTATTAAEEEVASTAEQSTPVSTCNNTCKVHPVVRILDEMKNRNDITSGWLRINDCISMNKQCPTNVRSFLSIDERELLLKLALILKPIIHHSQSRLAYAWGISRNSVTNIINRACENGNLAIVRKKRCDTGLTIQNSTKKRQSVYTPLFIFKRIQRTKYKIDNATIKNRHRKNPLTNNELQQMWNNSTSDVKEYYTNLARIEAESMNENNNNNNDNNEDNRNKPATVKTKLTKSAMKATRARTSISTTCTATTNDNMQDVEEEDESTTMTITISEIETETKKVPIEEIEDDLMVNEVMKHKDESDLLISDIQQSPKQQHPITSSTSIVDAESVIGSSASNSTSPASTSTTPIEKIKTESKNSRIDDDGMDFVINPIDSNNTTASTGTTTSDGIVGDILVDNNNNSNLNFTVELFNDDENTLV